MKIAESSGLLAGPVQRQSRQLTRPKCHHKVEGHYSNNQHCGWSVWRHCEMLFNMVIQIKEKMASISQGLGL